MPDEPPGKKKYPFAPNRRESLGGETPREGMPDYATPATPGPEGGEPPPDARIPIHNSQDKIPILSSPPAVDIHDTVRITPEPPGPGTPQYLGPYRVLHEIARGGMGTVFLGRDESLDRPVALKLMSPELLDDEDAKRRFEREARASAKIDHPNVARIYFVGESGQGVPFIAMEHVSGGSLESVIRDRVPMGYARVADIMLQVAEGLRAGYKQGIIHRDIKPANIMLSDRGEVRIVDFGLAKFMGENTYQTQAGMVMGTPRYMAPEQSQGREVDYRADIYSFGATFYHVLAGRTPFDGESGVQIMMKHVTAPVPPLKSVNPEAPLEFDDVVRRCLAKDPNERYQDYADLIGAVSNLKLQFAARESGPYVASVHDMPTLRQPPSAPGRGAPPPLPGAFPPEEHELPTPKWRWWIVGGAGVAALLLGGILLTFRPAGREFDESDEVYMAARQLREEIDKAREARNRALAGQPPEYEPSPGVRRYLEATALVSAFGRALLQYELETGERAASLRDITALEMVVADYETDTLGNPLDPWGVALRYIEPEQLVLSAGQDQGFGTPDDISSNPDGTVQVDDYGPYQRLMEADLARKEGVPLRMQ